MASNLQAVILSTVREIRLNAVALQVLFMLVKGQGRAWMLGCNNLCWAAIMVPDRLSPSVSPVQSSKQFPGRIQKVAEDSDHFQWQQHKWDSSSSAETKRICSECIFQKAKESWQKQEADKLHSPVQSQLNRMHHSLQMHMAGVFLALLPALSN